MSLFIAFNGPSPTTAAQAKVATGATIKTLLQIATPATSSIRLVEWYIGFDAAADAAKIQCELLQTDVAATVSSLTPTLYDGPLDEISLCIGGAALTGYTATVEGAITATRQFDAALVSPASYYYKQYPLGAQPRIPVSKFLRVRVTAPVGVNAICWVAWSE